ncbi:hypothetical protein [Dokdonella immobilis]|nr:hypothetical protein [Dokdonella immobilis]
MSPSHAPADIASRIVRAVADLEADGRGDLAIAFDGGTTIGAK